MANAVFRIRHAWRGFAFDIYPWIHMTLGWWTWDFFPRPISESFSAVVTELRKSNPGGAVVGPGATLDDLAEELAAIVDDGEGK